MARKYIRKLTVVSLMLAMILSSISTVFAAAPIKSDISGHWAEAQISNWVDKELIKGYADGSFKPDHSITRAEFIALINRSFGFTETTEIAFRDVDSNSWVYPEVAKAVKAGYITGYKDGTIRADKPISREEAAAIVDRLLAPSASESPVTTFKDSDSIAAWAKTSVNAIVARGIMKGYGADNSFKPTNSITRAETVVMLDRAINAQTVVYDKAGNYGPAEGVKTVHSNVEVRVAGVTLQNMVINGDLLLGEGIGNGDAFINNVTVTGTVTVQGGGENSIHFNNCVLVDVFIDKKSGTGVVRIVSEGSTTVASVMVNSPATISEMNTTGKGFANVNLGTAIPKGSKVTLLGSFNTVNVIAQQIQVEIPEGSIESFNVNASAAGTSINLADKAKINALILDAVVKVIGKGTIVVATVNIPGTTFQTPPQTTTGGPTGTGSTGGATGGPSGPTGPTGPTTPTTPDPTPTTPDPTPTTPDPTPTTPDPTPTTPTTPDPVVKKGSVMGSVYIRALPNEQIVGVAISVYSGVQDNGSLVGTVVSDLNGEYSISDVPVGNYYLKLEMTGYQDLTVTPANHTVSEDAVTDASKAFMYRNMVKGYIKDSSGTPISNFGVTLYDSEDYDWYVNTHTDEDGAFYFYDVPQSEYLEIMLDQNIYSSSEIKVDSIGTNEVRDLGTIEFDYREDKRLSTFTLSGITFSPEFSPSVTDYEARVPNSVTSTIVSATTINPNATIGDGRLGEQPLRVGDNTIQIYVTPESGAYYTIYSVRVYREPGADQVAAVAKIEAVTDMASADSITIEDLNAAAGGEVIAVAENMVDYKTAIAQGATGDFDTWNEIIDMISSVAYYKAIAKIEAVTDAASADLITLSDLESVVYGIVVEENLVAYRLAIAAAADGALNESYKIYGLISTVNKEQVVAKIEAVTDTASAALITMDDLYIASDYAAYEENLAAYRLAIIAAADGELDTPEEIRALVQQINNPI